MDQNFTAKDYIDRSMDAVRAQNDARFAEMMTEIRSLHSDVSSKFSTLSADLIVLSGTVKEAGKSAERASEAASAAESAAKAKKWNVLFTALSVIAIVVAVFAVFIGAVQMTTAIMTTQSVNMLPSEFSGETVPSVSQTTPTSSAPETPTE